MPRLACLDQGTGLPVRKPAPRRYEHENPGDLVHVDIKKPGRIPDGGGHRARRRAPLDVKAYAGGQFRHRGRRRFRVVAAVLHESNKGAACQFRAR
jgi:hypothetical protein